MRLADCALHLAFAVDPNQALQDAGGPAEVHQHAMLGHTRAFGVRRYEERFARHFEFGKRKRQCPKAGCCRRANIQNMAAGIINGVIQPLTFDFEQRLALGRRPEDP